ncbi:MAG: hypothetical protein MHM6MM_000607 [Cercozoa sp. M6MM]
MSAKPSGSVTIGVSSCRKQEKFRFNSRGQRDKPAAPQAASGPQLFDEPPAPASNAPKRTRLPARQTGQSGLIQKIQHYDSIRLPKFTVNPRSNRHLPQKPPPRTWQQQPSREQQQQQPPQLQRPHQSGLLQQRLPVSRPCPQQRLPVFKPCPQQRPVEAAKPSTDPSIDISEEEQKRRERLARAQRQKALIEAKMRAKLGAAAAAQAASGAHAPPLTSKPKVTSQAPSQANKPLPQQCAFETDADRESRYAPPSLVQTHTSTAVATFPDVEPKHIFASNVVAGTRCQ